MKNLLSCCVILTLSLCELSHQRSVENSDADDLFLEM